jgi:AIPR protein
MNVYPLDRIGIWHQREPLSMIDLDYPQLLDRFPEHLDPHRSESASFLIWYLENYYRLDSLEAIDAVCDQTNDKGVVGIVVNDNDKTITILQSKISQSRNSAIGDKSLREFAGTISQFNSAESIQNVIDAAKNSRLASLAVRLELVNKIANHELRGEFVCNIEVDANGESFLKTAPHIAFVDKAALTDTYISDKRDLPIHSTVNFDTIGFTATEYTVDANTKAAIAPVKATELIEMDGIADQSLFAYNVRGPLGKTKVNKEIRASIQKPVLHKLFPLFHNGITVVAKDLRVTSNNISITDYFVVNGCQSLYALHANSKALTDNLRVLTKFIQLEPTSPWVKTVTEFSNNQNAVRERDFMANDPMQIRLQNEFRGSYAGRYSFEIKRGDAKEAGKVISNEEAGLLLMAFDLKEPWATHRKYQVFDDKHSVIFGRKEVTADRIVLCQVISEAISAALPSIKNQLIAKYALARYALVYIVRNILESDASYREIVTKPEKFVRDEDDRNRFRDCIRQIVGDVIVDLNAEVDEHGKDFDYRDKLRESDWIKKLSKIVVADYSKLIQRGRIQSFSDEWNERMSGN